MPTDAALSYKGNMCMTVRKEDLDPNMRPTLVN